MGQCAGSQSVGDRVRGTGHGGEDKDRAVTLLRVSHWCILILKFGDSSPKRCLELCALFMAPALTTQRILDFNTFVW